MRSRCCHISISVTDSTSVCHAVRAWVAAFPQSATARDERENFEKYRGRPNQANGPRRQSVVRHAGDGYLTLPVSRDGKTDDFQTFASVELPELIFTIGSRPVPLRPAVITMQRNSGAGGECCIANAGHDLLKHGQGFVLNLSTMTLQLR